MGLRGLVVLILLVAAVAMIPPTARAVNPTISNVTWNPWVPAHGETVIVKSDVVSPGGTPTVTASWCVLPPFTCIPFTMTNIGGGRYASPPITAAGPPYTGAHFNVSAVDPGRNSSFTGEYYVAFASTITVDIALSPPNALPSQALSVRGTVIYQNNSSVPAKFSAVDFRILETGFSWSSTSNATGAFTSGFTAPATIGSYTLRTTASNRTISGSKDRYFAVATAPTPDLAVVPGSLLLNPNSTVAGRPVTISVSVENRGTAAAGAFVVRINITAPSGSGVSRDFAVAGLGVGERTNESWTWTSAEGAWIVTVIIDPGQQVSELSKENNRAGRSITIAPAPYEGPSTTLMVVLVLAGVGVAALVAFAYRWRAGRRKGP
jgi:hypothetical protein